MKFKKRILVIILFLLQRGVAKRIISDAELTEKVF